MLPIAEESRGYDFLDPEHAEKWRGVFVASLRKVLETVDPTLTAEESALQYVESLCLRLLTMLCAAPSPLTVQDVEERVARTFPKPLDNWALTDARESIAQKRRKAHLPQDKVHQMLRDVLLYKVDASVSTMIAAILEYVSFDVLKLASTFVRQMARERCVPVTYRDVEIAICADKVLMDMFYAEWDCPSPPPGPALGPPSAQPSAQELSYADLVRDLVSDEKSFLRDLHLIIRVFKGELQKVTDDAKTIGLIFGNILDIYELSAALLGLLEDALEAAGGVGSCFEELAEVEEFRAYVRYTHTVTSPEARAALQTLLDDPLVWERLSTAGHGFNLAVKYLLPKLLLAPAHHVLLHHAYVLALLHLAPPGEDRESFKQVECYLSPIKKILLKALGNGPKFDGTLRAAARARRQQALDKCSELSRLVDNWGGAQCCSEFIREDTLSKITPGKRIAERRAYLFDGILFLCKPINSLVPVNTGASAAAGATQMKLKEKFHVRKMELIDRPDTDEAKHLFELCPRVGQPALLSCGSLADKRSWMCDLLTVNTRPMLDRTLDSILLDLEKKHPLKLPPPELYRFAVPDSPDNLVLEGQGTLIKGATLLKLVERLTYHVHADLGLVRTFLTTYRSFCSPAELLDLLIERFRIPEPRTVYDAPAEPAEQWATPASDADKLSKNTTREDWKRYRNEFQQPVKFRVINVLRHWVDQHFYDFEREPALLQTLKEFLLSVTDKPMRKWVASVLKTVNRKSQQGCEWEATLVAHVFDRAPPAPRRHPADPARHGWHPLALHPLELARQLTLLEFSLYRQVRPSELVGAVWTKKDKEKTSPNLLRIIKHTTNFTRWMEKWIVESENLEERVGVASRLLELAAALHELNNFNGVLAVVAAFESAAVHRLRNTYQLIPPRLTRTLDGLRALHGGHFRRYAERLRSINPPCVPFLGVHLTNILHIEEGNLDYLPNTELINFSKRRKVAEITGEIQQYQNQPYCLTVEPKTRAFLEALEPFPGLDDQRITNYLYERSLQLEPRHAAAPKQVPKFPRKYPELSLKPIKWSRRDARADAHGHSTSSNDDNLSVSQLSPTSSGWDSSSLSLCETDDSRSLTSERGGGGALASPRGGSLLDKGLALFDKNSRSTRSLSSREEPPSPRDRHSPRHERASSSERKTPAPALSPRAAPAPAPGAPEPPEELPPLLPRTSIASLGGVSEAPPSPPDRPLPSPKLLDLFRSAPALSPKRSPAPPPGPPVAPAGPVAPLPGPPVPPVAPLPGPPTPPALTPGPPPGSAPAQPGPAPRHDSVGLAFSFPPRGAAPPLTPPAPAPPPPPPLPPRRRVAAPAPPPPAPTPAKQQLSSAPPLPPRPPQPPPLLRPAHSAILQRRHLTTSNVAPKLPPKPPPPAVAPRTY